MKWEELTAPEFRGAVRRSKGVCVVPVGVVEKHGDHLPLGTDYLYASAVAARAAELEPAVVFPPYYFGQIHEARHLPGTVALSARLITELLGEVCAEIGRNGLKKIVLLNGHGGNRYLVPFAKSMLESERDYAVYLLDLDAYYRTGDDPGWQALRETEVDGHGGEVETSCLLATCPRLVRIAAISPRPGMPRGRLAHLGPVNTGITRSTTRATPAAPR
jgi:creatinine amidohydrolase